MTLIKSQEETSPQYVDDLNPKKIFSHNFDFHKHFDGDDKRDDCYFLHHTSGTAVLLYYSHANQEKAELNIEYSGNPKSISLAESDLKRLLQISS